MASGIVCPAPTNPTVATGIPFEPSLKDPGFVHMAIPGRRRSSRSTVSANVPLTRSRKQSRPSGRRVSHATHFKFPSRIMKSLTWENVVKPGFAIAVFLWLFLLGSLSSSNTEQSTALVHVPSPKEIARMDSALLQTTKWIQSQLNLLDMKINKEVTALKSEVEHMIENEAFSVASKIHSLKTQLDNVESSLTFLKKEGLITKQEAMQLVGTASNSHALATLDRSVTLDDVRGAAKRIVEAELEMHRADVTGRADYALASGGGSILEHSEGYYTVRPWLWTRLAARLRYTNHPNANKVIEPSFGEPGQCLPLRGSNVYVDIRLRKSIYADSVTLEHVSKKVAYDIKSAPKDFHVYGWLSTPGSEKVQLGEFKYDVDEASNVQTFKLSKAASNILINTVRVHVVSNYGCPTHTCLYRFRVHGTQPQAMVD